MTSDKPTPEEIIIQTIDKVTKPSDDVTDDELDIADWIDRQRGA